MYYDFSVSFNHERLFFKNLKFFWNFQRNISVYIFLDDVRKLLHRYYKPHCDLLPWWSSHKFISINYFKKWKFKFIILGFELHSDLMFITMNFVWWNYEDCWIKAAKLISQLTYESQAKKIWYWDVISVRCSHGIKFKLIIFLNKTLLLLVKYLFFRIFSNTVHSK